MHQETNGGKLVLLSETYWKFSLTYYSFVHRGLRRGGYAPATTDGYGCGYTISPKCVKILLTTFRVSTKSSGENFEKAFKQSMTDLYNTVIQNQNGDAKL